MTKMSTIHLITPSFNAQNYQIIGTITVETIMNMWGRRLRRPVIYINGTTGFPPYFEIISGSEVEIAEQDDKSCLDFVDEDEMDLPWWRANSLQVINEEELRMIEYNTIICKMHTFGPVTEKRGEIIRGNIIRHKSKGSTK